jgi:hypothetical protein
LDRSEEYRTLVNSHLTWLVELGWPLRFFYVLAWLIVFALCWPSGEHRWLAIPLGVWVSFAIAALFSSVAESPWLWIVPAICLLVASGFRIKRRIWPKPVIWLLPPGMAVLAVAGIFVFGGGRSEIRGSPDRVIIGPGEPHIWLVIDRNVIGQSYGRTLREFIQSGKAEKDTVGLIHSINSLGNVSGKTVILTGNTVAQDKDKAQIILTTAGRVLLLNPQSFPPEQKRSKENVTRVEVVFGEFSRSPAVHAWSEITTVRRIDGAGDFLPRWPEELMASQL